MAYEKMQKLVLRTIIQVTKLKVILLILLFLVK